jgi:hypothetical protein
MPTKSRRENAIITRFLSGYEGRSWADADVCWMDELLDGAVEAVAARKSDGQTLAIEHTIVEPFVSDKEDFAFFKDAFLGIEKDNSLAVEGRWIQVFIPVGTLHGHRKLGARDAIVNGVHSWIKDNRLAIPDGKSQHRCPVSGPPSAPGFVLTLNVENVPIKGSGTLHIRRQQVKDNLSDVVEKLLSKKLPKLIRSHAAKRILLLERQHMNLYPERILGEIEKRRAACPELAHVDEIWIVETMQYDVEGYLRFEHYEGGECVRSLDFKASELLEWSS